MYVYSPSANIVTTFLIVRTPYGAYGWPKHVADKKYILYLHKFSAMLMTDINRCLMLFRGIAANYFENGIEQIVTLWGKNLAFFRSKYGGFYIATTML